MSTCQDILDAAHDAKAIWESWFERSRGADRHYLDFGRDIKHFQGILEKHASVFDRVASGQRSLLPQSEFERWAVQTILQRQEVVGFVADTLVTCRHILIQNEVYLKKTADIWESPKWHLAGANDDAVRLRSKLKLHAAKIALLNNFEDRTRLAILRDRLLVDDGITPLPRALSDRYAEASIRNAPSSYTGIANFPLREGLDAFLLAFEQSTAKSTASSGIQWLPPVEDINNLAKARFIYGCMIQSQRFKSLARDSPWAVALANVFTMLNAEYRKWSQEVDQHQASHSKESFCIWPPEDISAARLAAEADEVQGEEKILEVPLVGSSSDMAAKSLLGFRRPGNQLRLYTFTSSSHTMRAPSDSPSPPNIVHLHKVQVIPRYALPPHPRTPPCMDLYLEGASTPSTYHFKTRDDLKRFQQALLGYKVVYEESCRWKIRCSGLIKNKMKGQGLVQILQAKPLPAIKASSPNMSAAGWAESAQPPRNRADSILSDRASISTAIGPLKRAPTAFIQERKDSVVAAHPHAPVLLILTEVNGQPTFIHVRLTEDITIRPQLCECSSANAEERDACKHTVLGSSDMSLRKFSVPAQKPHLWNLGLIGIPKHPKFDELFEEVKSVSWLSIETTVEERAEFQGALETIFKIRDKQQKQHKAAKKAACLAAERPATDRRGSSFTSLRSPSIRSPSIAQSEFAHRASTPNSLLSMMSTGSGGPPGTQQAENRFLAELPGDENIVYEIDSELSVVLNNEMV